jgi:hypothetical protein
MNSQANHFADHAMKLAAMTDMIVEQIRKVAELHDDGILSDEEFAAKKTELLSRL